MVPNYTTTFTLLAGTFGAFRWGLLPLKTFREDKTPPKVRRKTSLADNFRRGRDVFLAGTCGTHAISVDILVWSKTASVAPLLAEECPR